MHVIAIEPGLPTGSTANRYVRSNVCVCVCVLKPDVLFAAVRQGRFAFGYLCSNVFRLDRLCCARRCLLCA